MPNAHLLCLSVCLVRLSVTPAISGIHGAGENQKISSVLRTLYYAALLQSSRPLVYLDQGRISLGIARPNTEFPFLIRTSCTVTVSTLQWLWPILTTADPKVACDMTNIHNFIIKYT